MFDPFSNTPNPTVSKSRADAYKFPNMPTQNAPNNTNRNKRNSSSRKNRNDRAKFLRSEFDERDGFAASFLQFRRVPRHKWVRSQEF
jgi:hypothetical protein